MVKIPRRERPGYTAMGLLKRKVDARVHASRTQLRERIGHEVFHIPPPVKPQPAVNQVPVCPPSLVQAMRHLPAIHLSAGIAGPVCRLIAPIHGGRARTKHMVDDRRISRARLRIAECRKVKAVHKSYLLKVHCARGGNYTENSQTEYLSHDNAFKKVEQPRPDKIPFPITAPPHMSHRRPRRVDGPRRDPSREA